MPDVFSSSNFYEIQAFSLSTYINLSEKLFTPNFSWMACWYTSHLCTLLSSFLARISTVGFFPRNQDWASQNIPRLVVPLGFTSSLPHYSQCACLHYTQEQCRKTPKLSLERLALKLEAMQLLSCGFASGFPVLLLSSAAGGSTAFVS